MRYRVRVGMMLVLSCLFCGMLIGCSAEGGNSEDTHIEAEVLVEDAKEAAFMMIPLQNGYGDISVPTQITKIGDLYYVVDCYHNQVICNENLEDIIWDWQVVTYGLGMGHTIASDGEVYLIDDTENHRVLVFEYVDNVFVNTQVFEGIGNRPHYIVYNEADKCFYVWSSMTGQMYVMKHDEGSKQMYISRIMTIEELDGVYARSFTLDGDSIYIVSGNKQILEVATSNFKIKHRYQVPDSMAGMVQIMPVDGGYYITISTDASGNQDYATIIFTEKLEDLEDNKYTDIYSYFIGGGTPYYIGEIDGKYYLTEHRIIGHTIWSFDIDENHMPTNVVALY